jgi:sigma-B regulation protein RsbU (phosphoserine phosphatase)
MTIVAPSPSAWIREACRQFSGGVGWDLQFLAATDASAEDLENQLRTDSEAFWFSEVTDGNAAIGFLKLILPLDRRRDSTFPAVADLAEAFAQLISRSLIAARLLESRTNELSTLVDIGRSAPSEENLLGALERLLGGATQLTAFRSAAFYLLDPSTERLNLRAIARRDAQLVPAESRNLSDNPPDLEALARGRVVVSGNPDPRLQRWLPPGTATAVCLCVGSDSGPIGTLWVFDRRRREPTDRELHVLESIAVQIATLLERIVLLRESAAQHRIQRDLQLASQCQSSDVMTALLPETGILAAARSTSRFEIGGDLCELISVNRDLTVISIGDASGHGISAAIVMSAVRGAVRALSLHSPARLAPDEVLAQVNRALHSITPPHQFMSLFYAVVDTARNVLTYSNAGHPSPMLLKGDQEIALESHGLLLGVLEETTYGASELPIASGDTLVAFTDGVSEAMNGKRKMFRSDGIIEALLANQEKSPKAIVDSIWQDLESHLDGSTSHDDRSLLVVRIR